ncbi:MAG: hypothetical protein ABIT76_13950 [Chthoniobacterales bacterium]
MSSTPAPIHPLRAGWEAARATFLPGLVVQSVMICVVLVYYFVPTARPVFDQIGLWKLHGGLLFSSVSAMIAGGVLPEVLRVVFFQKGRVLRRNWANLAFAVPYWGVQGIWVDLLYRGQADWFGNDAHPLTLLKKVCVDQFLYNPLLAAPFGVTLYEWKHRGYRWSREFLTWHWYRTRIFPGLIATWSVWIPVVSIVYCLPQILQIPIFCLALTFWVTMFTWMTEILAPNAMELRS